MLANEKSWILSNKALRTPFEKPVDATAEKRAEKNSEQERGQSHNNHQGTCAQNISRVTHLNTLVNDRCHHTGDKHLKNDLQHHGKRPEQGVLFIFSQTGKHKTKHITSDKTKISAYQTKNPQIL
jgi:hypothetical protein